MNNPMQRRPWIPRTLARAAAVAPILTVLLGLGAAVAVPAQAQGYAESVLHSFTGGTGGATPTAGLTLDAQGNMFGTTAVGGNLAECSGQGCGTVFMMDPLGNETVLYSFTGGYAEPSSSLVLNAQGDLYGTTAAGGTDDFGTVFKVDAAGNETTLHNFTGTNGDGINPIGGLVPDGRGNLYGTTNLGGSRTQCGGSGCGTVFRIDAQGNEQVLYSFVGITPDKVDGSEPSAGLVLDALGNLYGTTTGGGNTGCDIGGANYGGCGTVFKLDTAGNETLLYKFTGGADGGNPFAGLVMDATGNLYGTTANDGATGGGTVFKLDATGKLNVLYNFPETAWDGVRPQELVMDPQGNIYGTTWNGGLVSNGTVFKMDATGKETVLHSFLTAAGDGSSPVGSLAIDAQGNIYGTTEMGGASHDRSLSGTVYKLAPAPTTTTVVTSSRNPLILGKNMTLTATVTSPGGGTPTGKIYFYDSNFDQGTGPMFKIALKSGVAKIKASLWPLGSNIITAIYTGDSNYSMSTSASFLQIVQESTTTTLTSTPNPSVYGQTVTFTAQVTCNLGAPPDGESVTFVKGKTTLGTGLLSGGSASFVTLTLKVGTTAVTAVYGGDTNLAASKSQAIKQVVTKAGE
jgi:uncharacterized repeat protein (TIGR03803 family)